MFDAELYRDKAEVERWKSLCPIRRFSTWLQENSFLHEQDVAAIEADVAAIVAQAVAFAEAGAVGAGRAVDPRRDHAAPGAVGLAMSQVRTRTISYREGVREALREALQRDPRVFLMGEDVGRYGGAFACSKGLQAEFGEERVRDAPLSESGFTGAGIGAALGGMRPIVEVMTVNFSLLALDQIVNNAATLRHMSGGQFSVPLVIRMATGAGRQLAAQHSHSLECWYAHVPGIRVLAPATVADARGMLWTALLDPDPVVIFEHAALYNDEGEVPVEGDARGGYRARRRAPARRGRQPHHLWRQREEGAGGCAESWRSKASKRKWSTCAHCGRWTRRRSLPRWRKRIAR